MWNLWFETGWAYYCTLWGWITLSWSTHSFSSASYEKYKLDTSCQMSCLCEICWKNKDIPSCYEHVWDFSDVFDVLDRPTSSDNCHDPSNTCQSKNQSHMQCIAALISLTILVAIFGYWVWLGFQDANHAGLWGTFDRYCCNSEISSSNTSHSIGQRCESIKGKESLAYYGNIGQSPFHTWQGCRILRAWSLMSSPASKDSVKSWMIVDSTRVTSLGKQSLLASSIKWTQVEVVTAGDLSVYK